MNLRFSLRHNPDFPNFATQWTAESGSWIIDSDPSVTVPSVTSVVLVADWALLPGTYYFDYNFTITAAGNSVVTLNFEKNSGTQSVGNDDTGFLNGAGTYTGTFQILITETSETVDIAFANSSVNTKTLTINSLTIRTDAIPISEPDGWKGAKIKLERDDNFMSLIEHYEGSAGGAFNFYGENGDEDGGIVTIKAIEEAYGFDSNIVFLAEFAPDDVNYEEIFQGLLDISGKNEEKDNKMQVPVIRDDFWAKFISRMETPVNISDLVDLDGNPVDDCPPITINLSSQKIVKKIISHLNDGRAVEQDGIVVNSYMQFDFDTEDLSEIDKKYNIPITSNPERPQSLIDIEETGDYTFDIRIEMSIITESGGSAPACLGNSYIRNPTSSYLDVYIQKNDETPIAFSSTDFITDSTAYTYSGTLNFVIGDQVRIYGIWTDVSWKTSGPGPGFGSLANVLIWGSDNTEVLLDRGVFSVDGGGTICELNSIVFGNRSFGTASSGDTNPTRLSVLANTIYPSSQAQGYLIHDLIHGVLARYGLGTDPFYSEFLGSTFTNTKQYDEDGCGWMYAIVKGLQIRQYSLVEKPFFISFKQIWDGINPILNLGLGYEIVNDVQIVRIEEKDHFLEDTVSVNFSNVRQISSSYDQNMIFKTIKTGYKKWQAEDISGNDDPQTKKTYATRFEKVGKDLTLESEFIAAGIAIETTRRTKREKSADYKYDNDNFIIALNTDDVSPDVYAPELDENFNSITNLNNSDTRYNSILIPSRSLFRWAPYIGGCLQSYTTSVYKFVSGEGNYDMVSDYNCGSGNECQAIICDSISEKQDISLAIYNAGFGYYFLPILFDIVIPMEWEEFQEIRSNRKKSIGISQTTAGHIPFKIKLLEYDIVKGEATIKAWPKTFFSIQVINEYNQSTCD